MTSQKETPAHHQHPKMKHQYSLLILEGHLDTFGHVNHAKYLELLEEARWDLITRNGYGLDRVIQSGQGPIILEARIEFKRELRLRQRIVIETEMVSYKKKIAIIHHWIKNEEGKICAEADITIALFDMQKRKLITPTEDWLRAIGVMEN